MAFGDVSLAGMQNEPLWRQLMQRLQQYGVQVDPSQSGGVNNRFIAGTTTPSLHAARDAFGHPASRAYDVNWGANPRGQLSNSMPAFDVMYGDANAAQRPTQTITPDIGRNVASQLGMRWGGDFSNPDPMHFELARGVPIEARSAFAGLPRPMGAMALGGPKPEPEQDFQTEFPGTTSFSAPINPPERPLTAPVPPDVAAVPAPVTTGSVAPRTVERRGDMSGGMAPAIAGGGGFGNYIQGLGMNPLFLAGLTMLSGQGPAAGAQIANTALTQRRAETLFQQQQAEYNKRQQIWNDAFPNGQPNTAHALLKGLTPGMASTIYSLGPEAGLPVLGKYQLADAEARQAMERQLELAQRSLQQFGLSTPGSAGAAPTPAPAAAASPPFGQTVVTPPTGTVVNPPQAITPSSATPAVQAPAASPAAPASLAPTASPQPGIVQLGNMRMTIPEAQAMAVAWEQAKIPTTELRAAISAAQAPGQAAATKTAEGLAERQLSKPQARATLSQLLDSVERTDALATKIHNNPNLSWATGYMSKLPTWTGGQTHGVMSDMNQLVKQVGLSTLQALREASKTGSSGLGSTSEVEIKMLQNALAALDDPAISTEKYKENLEIVQQSSQRIRARMLGAWKETYGEDFREPGGAPAPYPRVSAPEAAKARANEKMKRGGWEIRSLD